MALVQCFPSYWGVGQAYAQAQVSALTQYLQYQLTTARIALGILSAPSTGAAAVQVARTYGPQVATMCMTAGANPRLQQAGVDLITSMFPGTPAMSVAGLVGGIFGSQTNPQEILR